jgi:hypothetical protein
VTVLSGGRVGGPSTSLITLIMTVRMMSGGWTYRPKADRIESWRAESCYLSTCSLLLMGARSATVSTVAEAFLVVSVAVKRPHI